FAFGHRFRALAGKTASDHGLRQTTWRTITFLSGLELLVGIYGGYFGAGIGFITLGMLAALGMRDVHVMNALRTLRAVVLNVAAVATSSRPGLCSCRNASS